MILTPALISNSWVFRFHDAVPAIIRRSSSCNRILDGIRRHSSAAVDRLGFLSRTAPGADHLLDARLRLEVVSLVSDFTICSVLMHP